MDQGAPSREVGRSPASLRHALYYPEWGVPEPALLVETLLYWDRLAVLVPFQGFSPIGAVDRDFRKASDALHERFVTGIAPTERQKQAVHARIEALVDRVPPDRYRPQNLTRDQRANISAMKMAPLTEELLRRRGWMIPLGTDEFAMQEISLAAANLLIGELIAEMESERLPALTGDPAAYAATTNTLLREIGADASMTTANDGDRVRAEPTHDALMLALPFVRAGLPPGAVTPALLEKVLELRNDPDIEGRRVQFVAKVDEFVALVRKSPPEVRPLIADDWREALTLDRNAYTAELRRAGLRALVDKDSIVTLLVESGAAGVALPALGPIGFAVGATIAAVRTAMRFQAGRHEVSARHWTSFLFALDRPRFGIQL